MKTRSATRPADSVSPSSAMVAMSEEASDSILRPHMKTPAAGSVSPSSSTMSEEASDGAEDHWVSIPRGGPIYFENMVGPLTSVPDFEYSVLTQLQNLKLEVSWDSDESCDEDISVDELKILKEEDLVNKVLEDDNLRQVSQVSDGVNHGTLSSEENSEKVVDREDVVISEVSPNGEFVGGKNKRSNANVSRKAKKRRHFKQKNGPLEERYVTKVEEVTRIKQKQEEDKAAARLHSFNGSNSRTKGNLMRSSKMDRTESLRSTSSSAKVKLSSVGEHIPIQFPETILCLEVYHSRKTFLKTQEFWVLGRQFLTELKDKIYCLADVIMEKAGQYDPSGYFLIEDVFCNDLRQPSATDYSQPIFEWLEQSRTDALKKWECIGSGNLEKKQKAVLGNQSELRLPRFQSVDMQNTRLCDLKFRLGAAYLYCHQGDCKHAIVIRDMRLIHPEDIQNRAVYPLVTFKAKLLIQKCSACRTFRATKFTVDDIWAGENPCYFCDLCYSMLHYNKDGKLRYEDFCVYDYLHD